MHRHRPPTVLLLDGPTQVVVRRARLNLPLVEYALMRVYAAAPPDPAGRRSLTDRRFHREGAGLADAARRWRWTCLRLAAPSARARLAALLAEERVGTPDFHTRRRDRLRAALTARFGSQLAWLEVARGHTGLVTGTDGATIVRSATPRLPHIARPANMPRPGSKTLMFSGSGDGALFGIVGYKPLNPAAFSYSAVSDQS